MYICNMLCWHKIIELNINMDVTMPVNIFFNSNLFKLMPIEK